jgi:hypothetical protein
MGPVRPGIDKRHHHRRRQRGLVVVLSGALPPPRRQIGPICAVGTVSNKTPEAEQNGGSECVQLALVEIAQRASVGAGCMVMRDHSAPTTSSAAVRARHTDP